MLLSLLLDQMLKEQELLTVRGELVVGAGALAFTVIGHAIGVLRTLIASHHFFWIHRIVIHHIVVLVCHLIGLVAVLSEVVILQTLLGSVLQGRLERLLKLRIVQVVA